MMLRPVPVIITIIVSCGLLFGGWFAYQALAMKEPFLAQVEALEGVEHIDFRMERDRALVRVVLTNDANLRKTVQEFEKAARASLGGRPLLVEAHGVQGSNEMLESLWSSALFDVAEAMERGTYSSIPEVMHNLRALHPHIAISAEMDEANVYITMRDGEHAKYIVLPRRAPQLGVWPHE